MKSELLLPAGSLVKLKTAILYGADAVYAGTPDMSLRVQSKMSLADIKEGIEFVHARGKKIYLTLNLFTKNADISKLPDFVKTIRELKPDGVIMADPGIFAYFKEFAPEIKRHISTQANVCSYQTVKFWEDLGADLCVLGREVSFAELKEIKKRSNIKIESFMHGAMCMSYSGRCLISNFLADRSANQGKCAHCCRWHYKIKIRAKDGTIKDIEINEQNKDAFEFFLQEDFRPDELYEVIEDEKGSYLMNSKDLCLMPRLDDLLSAGIDSLKVEGRNKTEYYAAIVARTYRQAIDDYYAAPKNWDYKKYMPELDTLQNRGYCLGFHDGQLTNLGQNYEYTRTLGDWQFAGSIVEWQENDAILELRNYIDSGEWIEFLSPNGENIRISFEEFEDAQTAEISNKVSAGQGKQIRIKNMAHLKEKLPQYSIARKPAPISTDNKKMLDNKKNEFEICCNQE